MIHGIGPVADKGNCDRVLVHSVHLFSNEFRSDACLIWSFSGSEGSERSDDIVATRQTEKQ